MDKRASGTVIRYRIRVGLHYQRSNINCGILAAKPFVGQDGGAKLAHVERTRTPAQVVAGVRFKDGLQEGAQRIAA